MRGIIIGLISVVFLGGCQTRGYERTSHTTLISTVPSTVYSHSYIKHRLHNYGHSHYGHGYGVYGLGHNYGHGYIRSRAHNYHRSRIIH